MSRARVLLVLFWSRGSVRSVEFGGSGDGEGALAASILCRILKTLHSFAIIERLYISFTTVLASIRATFT